MESIIDNISTLGPILAISWGLTIALTVLRPQRYLNSFLLMFSLLVTMIFVTGFFGEAQAYALLACFLLIMLALLLAPILLIINGITMIRRESLCLAHVLSLALGIFVGVGEVASIVYVFGLSGAEEAQPWLLLLTFTVFYFSYLVLSFVVYSIFIQVMPHKMNFNYVIIHGCGLLGGDRMTKLLSNRVDKAIEIYQRCAIKPFIIPSGGQGPDEQISEAQAMGDYLREHDIPQDHIILEDQSATTQENLANSKAIIDARDGTKKTALVSSNYHVYRCLRLAKEVGLPCTGIGAPVALYYWPSALIREFIAVYLTKPFFIKAMIGYLLFVSPVLFLLTQ